MQKKYRWHTGMGISELEVRQWAFDAGWMLLSIQRRSWSLVAEFLAPVQPTTPPYGGALVEASDLPLLRK